MVKVILYTKQIHLLRSGCLCCLMTKTESEEELRLILFLRREHNKTKVNPFDEQITEKEIPEFKRRLQGSAGA